MLLFYYISNSVNANVVFFHRSLEIIIHKGHFIPVLMILFILSVLSRVLILNLKRLFSSHQEQPSLIRVCETKIFFTGTCLLAQYVVAVPTPGENGRKMSRKTV